MRNREYVHCPRFKQMLLRMPIIKKIALHFNLAPCKPLICKGPGFDICVRPPKNSHVGRDLYFYGIWEKEMTSIVKSKVQNGWNILDIGADVGYYSLLFASKCGEQGAVAAFDPDPEPWPILNYNIKMFPLSNISAFHLALSDHDGHGMMKVGGRGQLFPDQEGKEDDTSTVEMTTLDKFWPKLNWDHLDLVKIDTEGAEMSILLGMENIIKKYHPHLLIEVHPLKLKKIFNSSAEKLFEYITEEFPYKLTPVDSKTLDIPSKGNITVWADWVEE